MNFPALNILICTIKEQDRNCKLFLSFFTLLLYIYVVWYYTIMSLWWYQIYIINQNFCFRHLNARDRSKAVLHFVKSNKNKISSSQNCFARFFSLPWIVKTAQFFRIIDIDYCYKCWQFINPMKFLLFISCF